MHYSSFNGRTTHDHFKNCFLVYIIIDVTPMCRSLGRSKPTLYEILLFSFLQLFGILGSREYLDVITIDAFVVVKTVDTLLSLS